MQLKGQVAILVVVGVVLIAGSLVFNHYFDHVFNSMLEKKLLLVPGSQTVENFKDPPVPIFMQFYFFNVTNSQAVLQGATPVLQQVGPYTFSQRPIKHDLVFDDDEGSVTYVQNKTYYFRKDLSKGYTLDDQITTINVLMTTLAAKFHDLPDILKAVIELWFVRFNMQLFITKRAGELLFDGYDEPLLEELAPITKDPLHATGKFGLFYPKNNSNDGTYSVYTGINGMENYQHILRWKGKEDVDYWKTDMWGGNTCNLINGTTGNQFPRPMVKDKKLYLFTSDLCRSIYLRFQKEVSHGPLTLYRYALPGDLLADKEENRCYCPSDFSCRASMINVSPCRKGAPVVMSTPHFYQGEQEDQEQVVGLNPREEEHETYLDIEPTTGVTFRAAKRIQVNIALKRYSNLPAFENVPELILPVLWANESVVVPLERTSALHRTLTLPFLLLEVATWVLVALGIILILVAIVKVVLAMRRKSKQPHTAKNRKDKMDRENGVTEKLNNINAYS